MQFLQPVDILICKSGYLYWMMFVVVLINISFFRIQTVIPNPINLYHCSNLADFLSENRVGFYVIFYFFAGVDDCCVVSAAKFLAD